MHKIIEENKYNMLIKKLKYIITIGLKVEICKQKEGFVYEVIEILF